MRKLENVKKWIWIPILLLVAVIAIVIVLFVGKANASESLFNLSERDILLEIGESKKVELESEINFDESKIDVSWTSSKPSVATVKEGGTIVASEGGETKVTAVVEYKGKTYITSCMVTVKSEDKEYSIYKLRWYTQKQDRSGYDIKEETFDRLIGSSVEMTEADANKNLPANYVLNKEKSTLTGTVKENLNGCILEVYFDVAQISYSVDYYYESDTKLGTYPTKETKKYTAYAFSKVQVTDKPKTGFVINKAIAGTVMSKDSVVSGSRLKVYCDRIRSKVTVTYLSGRASATYDCIYGIGLLNAPDDVFTDSTEYKITTYINGKKKTATKELMKTVTKDTTVAFGLNGVGFTYSLVNGQSVITNTCSEKKTPCYAILNGSSDTIYLKATYNITGSTSNRFGITLRSGTTSRQIRFYKQGFAIMKDHTTEGGIPTAQDKTNALRNATRYIGNFNGQNAYVWAQNTTGSKTTEVNSIITDMLRNKAGGSYDICWAVSDGVLYCTVEDVPVLCLPLTCLDETWTPGQKYQIGFSSYDGSAWEDELQITNVNLALGKNAKALLKLEDENLIAQAKYMVYEPITGSYLPAVKNASSGAAYMYGTAKTGNAGVSATINWVDIEEENTASAVGISIKLGDQSVEYLVQGQNGKVRRQDNQKYANNVLKIQVPFTENGTADVNAFVKDGYFYVMYNGTQVQCINMLSLFPDYNKETSEVSFGFSYWDANLGLATISNVKELGTEAVANMGTEWGFYSESLAIDSYSFENASITKTKSGNKTVTLLGSNATWQIDGVMARPAKANATDTEEDLNMGFFISNGDNGVRIVGNENGFKVQKMLYVQDEEGNWKWTNNGNKWKLYNGSYKKSKYSFNSIVTDKFFNVAGSATRTQNELGFKAVLYDSTLYVWFDDAAHNGTWFDGTSNEGLCWRIPLKEFGEFTDVTDYEVALYLLNSTNSQAVTGSIEDLNVQMGYQVTGQTEFVSDNSGTVYAFGDAIKNIDANVARWDDDFQLKTISGMMAEELDTSWNFGDTKTNSVTLNGAAYAYLDGSGSDIYLSATYELDSTVSKALNDTATAKFFGISIRDKNGQSRQVYYHTNGVYLYVNYDFEYEDEDGNKIPAMYDASGNKRDKKYYTDVRAGVVWGTNTTTNPKNTVYTMIQNAKKDGSLTDYDVKWAITDGYLYGMVDGFVFLKMSVTELCESWNAETEFQIGLAQFNIFKANGSGYNSGDVVTTKNIEVAFGNKALAKMVTDKKVSGATLDGMTYEVLNGSYLPYQASGTKTLYGTATNGTQVLETAIKLESVNTNSYYGIAVKMTDSENNEKSAAIEARGTNYRLRINRSVDTDNLYIEDWIRSEAKLYESLEYKVKAVVKDSTLYIFYGNDSGYKLAGSVDLYKLLPGYQEGTAVQLGVCATGTKFGLGTFSDVSIATEEAKVTEALTGITLSDDYEWEILTNADGAANYTGTNMTGSVSTSGTANIVTCTPTANITGAAYIYGAATSMNQKLTTKINLAEQNSTYSSHGITVKCGDESVQFYIEGIKTEIRITYGYDWNAYAKVDFTEKLHNNGVYDITAIVKDGTFYIKYNDNVAYKIALNSLFDNYGNSNKEVKLGVCSWDILPYNGTVNRLATFSDVFFEAGTDVTEGTTTYEAIKYATKFNENANFSFSNDGKITKKTANKNANMLFTGESTTWEVSGTIRRTDTANVAFRPGFYIKQGDKWLAVFGNSGGIGFNGGVTSFNTSETDVGTHVLYSPENTKMFSKGWSALDTTITFKAIISGNVLYVWLDGEAAWRVDLTEFGSGTNKFDSTKPYSFGLHMYGNNTIVSTGEFNITTVKTSGIDTEAITKFNEKYPQ